MCRGYLGRVCVPVKRRCVSHLNVNETLPAANPARTPIARSARSAGAMGDREVELQGEALEGER